MKKIYKIIIILSFVISLLSASKSFAQDNILSGMRQLPQYTNNNPAFQPKASVYVGFPIINSIYFDLHHTGFTFNTAIKPMPKNYPDSFYYDLKDIENSLKDKNYISAELNISLINFGFALKNNFYFTFAINTKVQQDFKYSNILKIAHGNYNENGKPINFNFGENFNSYNEIAIGLSKNLYNGFTIGGKVKLLSGVSNINVSKANIDWSTKVDGSNPNENFYDWTFNSDFDINASSLFEFKEITDTMKFEDYFTPKYDEFLDSIKPMKALFSENMGLGLDFGVNYDINKKFSISASIIDFGFIKWKSNARVLTQKDSFVFPGVDVSAFIEDSDDVTDVQEDGGNSVLEEFVEALKDTLNEKFDPDVADKEYTTKLNSRIFIGGNWHATKNLDLNVLYRGHIYADDLHSALTFSGNWSFFEGCAVSASYSLMDYSYNNIGLGFAWKVGWFQFYMMADNVSSLFWAASDSQIADDWIRNTKRATVHLGLNLVFHRSKEHCLLE